MKDEDGAEISIADELAKSLGASPSSKLCELILMGVVSAPPNPKKRKAAVIAGPIQSSVTSEPTAAVAAPLKKELPRYDIDEEYVDLQPPKKMLKYGEEPAAVPTSLPPSLSSSQVLDAADSEAPRRSNRTPKKKKRQDALEDDEEPDDLVEKHADKMEVDEKRDLGGSSELHRPKAKPVKRKSPKASEPFPVPAPVPLSADQVSGVLFSIRSSQIVLAFQDLAVHLFGLEGVIVSGIPTRAEDKPASKGSLQSIGMLYDSKLARPSTPLPQMGEAQWQQNALRLSYVPLAKAANVGLIDFQPSLSTSPSFLIALSETGYPVVDAVRSALKSDQRLLLSTPQPDSLETSTLSSSAISTQKPISHILRARSGSVVFQTLAQFPQRSEAPATSIGNIRGTRRDAFADLIDKAAGEASLLVTVSVPVLDQSPSVPVLFNLPTYAAAAAVPIPQTLAQDTPKSSHNVRIQTTDFFNVSTRFFPLFEAETLLFSSRETESFNQLVKEIKLTLLRSSSMTNLDKQRCTAAVLALLTATVANDQKLFKSAASARRKESLAFLWLEIRKLTYLLRNHSDNHRLVFEEISKLVPLEGQHKTMAAAASTTISSTSNSPLATATAPRPAPDKQLDDISQESRAVNNSEMFFKDDVTWGRAKRKAVYPAPPQNPILSAAPDSLYTLVRIVDVKSEGRS